MRRASFLMLIFVLFCTQAALAGEEVSQTRQETAAPNVFLSSPMGGQALQGVVTIEGNSAIAMFQSASLTFSYTGDTTGARFFIHENDAPVAYDILAQWDTTTITDGNYDLYLTVLRTDGSQISASVEGLRVRNYSAVETDTPTPLAPSATPAGETLVPVEIASPTTTTTPIPTATDTPIPPTITPLPTNPAEITQAIMLNTLGKGGLAALGLFALLGSYLAIQSILKRPRKQRKP